MDLKRCFNCRQEKCTQADYCHGCKQFVCRQCDATKPMGPHDKAAHLGPVKP